MEVRNGLAKEMVVSCKDETEIVLSFKKDFVHMCSVIQFMETMKIIYKGNVFVWKVSHKNLL